MKLSKVAMKTEEENTRIEDMKDQKTELHFIERRKKDKKTIKKFCINQRMYNKPNNHHNSSSHNNNKNNDLEMNYLNHYVFIIFIILI